jgi:hypothetical protein
MIFTNPSGKKRVVSTSMKKCDLVTTESNNKKEVVQILVKSIQSISTPNFSISALPYNQNASSDLSDLSVRDINKARSKEILMGVFG